MKTKARYAAASANDGWGRINKGDSVPAVSPPSLGLPSPSPLGSWALKERQRGSSLEKSPCLPEVDLKAAQSNSVKDSCAGCFGFQLPCSLHTMVVPPLFFSPSLLSSLPFLHLGFPAQFNAVCCGNSPSCSLGTSLRNGGNKSSE